jgi:hypothetical protein
MISGLRFLNDSTFVVRQSSMADVLTCKGTSAGTNFPEMWVSANPGQFSKGRKTQQQSNWRVITDGEGCHLERDARCTRPCV